MAYTTYETSAAEEQCTVKGTHWVKQMVKFWNNYAYWAKDSTATWTGAHTFSNTVTVGENDTGYDVKLFGATASAYLLWDESIDALVTAGVAHLHLSGIDADAGEGVGSVIQMGVSGTPLTSSEDETELISCYVESSGKNIYGMRMQVEKTAASAGAPRALTLRAILSHSSGFAPQGANSVDARATLEAGNTGISGEIHAMESQCRVDDQESTTALQGTYAAHKFTNKFGENNTMPATTYFARFIEDGDVYTPYLFEVKDVETAADDADVLFRTGGANGNGDEIKAGLKCYINGATYYIACIASGDWSDS